MNAPARHQPPATSHPAKPKGFDIIWTNRAAKRMVQRQFDPDEVMEAIAHLCASGTLAGDRKSIIKTANFQVVAVLRTGEDRNGRTITYQKPRLVIITVKHTRSHNNYPRRNRRKRR